MTGMRHQKRSTSAGKMIVLATGVFDILHPGHLKFLEESKRKGGRGARLVVVVARDETVLDRKGRRPVLPENERRKLVQALRVVDRAILGHKRLDLLGVLREVKPKIVTVGYDQNQIKRAVRRAIEKEKLPIRVMQIRKFGPSWLNSSTKIKSRVLRERGRSYSR